VQDRAELVYISRKKGLQRRGKGVDKFLLPEKRGGVLKGDERTTLLA